MEYQKGRKRGEEKNNSILSDFLNKILTIKLVHLEEKLKENKKDRYKFKNKFKRFR